MIKKIWTNYSSIIITYLVVVFLIVFISVLRPGFTNVNNLTSLEALTSILGLTTLGQTFVILTGGMDLSIPWMLTVSSFVFCNIAAGDGNKIWFAVIIVLALGIFMGVINGLGIAFVGIAPVIMTMATNIIFQGLLIGVTGGTPGSTAPKMLQAFSKSSVLGISSLFLFWIAISVIALIVLYKIPYGRQLYAVGNSSTVARFSGINSKKIIIIAYAISGLMSAVAGILFSGRLGNVYLGMGDAYQMDSIAAVAIGGISLAGGSGSYIGAMAGAMILTILSNVLTALNVQTSVQEIIIGIVLFAAVLLASIKHGTKKKNIEINKA